MPIPNLAEYTDKKVAGLITIQKIDDDDFAIGTKNFDPSDGSELPQTVVGVNINEVDEAIATKQTEIDELKAFKVDLQAVAK